MEADVGVGTVYRRFKNKQQLANAVANEVISEIYEDQEQILKSDFSAVEKVQQIFACYAKITQKYGQIHPMIVELLVSEEGDTEFRNTFLQSLNKLYAETINTGQKEGVFREGDPRVYEIFLQNMINPFIIKQIAELMPLKETPYFLADLALNVLLKKTDSTACAVRLISLCKWIEQRVKSIETGFPFFMLFVFLEPLLLVLYFIGKVNSRLL